MCRCPAALVAAIFQPAVAWSITSANLACAAYASNRVEGAISFRNAPMRSAL